MDCNGPQRTLRDMMHCIIVPLSTPCRSLGPLRCIAVFKPLPNANLGVFFHLVLQVYSVRTVWQTADVFSAVLLLLLLDVLQVGPCDAGGCIPSFRWPLLLTEGRLAERADGTDAALSGTDVDIPAALRPTSTGARREGVAKRVAEVFRSMVVDDWVHARVGVRQRIPNNAHHLQISSQSPLKLY